MSDLRMRPRFEMWVDQVSVDETLARLKARVEQPESICRADTYDHQLEIRIKKPYHHFWSPELNIVFREAPGGTHLSGVFGPGAHIWTLFMAGYAVFGMTAGAGLLVLFSQWMLNLSPWGLYLIIAGTLGASLIYLLAQMGRRIAQEQMQKIRRVVEEVFPGNRST